MREHGRLDVAAGRFIASPLDKKCLINDFCLYRRPYLSHYDYVADQQGERQVPPGRADPSCRSRDER